MSSARVPDRDRSDPSPTRRSRALATLVALLLIGACSSGGSGRTVRSSTTASEPGTTTTRPAPEQPERSAGCGRTTTLHAGTQDVALQSGHLRRRSDVYLPKGYSDDKPAPLIVDFHAFAPRSIEEGFSGLTLPRPDKVVPADRAGTIVLTPLGIAAGTTPAWNVTHYSKWANDEQFTLDLLDHIEQRACVDTRRVYLTGFAIGAQMAAVVACDHADRITAFAAVSGLFDPTGCRPARPVPVLAFHGTADPMIPYRGGIGPNVPKLGLDAATTAGETAMVARLEPIPDVVRTWVRRDGCDAPASSSKPAPDVTLSQWTDCSRNATVELYLFNGGGHAWPQSPGTSALAGLLGPTPRSIPATDVMLRFFARQRLPAKP